MSNFGFDDWIDAQLRNVPVPPDLLPRIADDISKANAGNTEPGDTVTGISQTVVPPPVGAATPVDTTVRLYPHFPTSADSRLDTVLRNVPVPSYLEARLRRIARQRRTPPTWLRVGLAASVFVALGLGAAGYVGLISGGFGRGDGTLAKTNQDVSVADHANESVNRAHGQRNFAVGPLRAATLAKTDPAATPSVEEKAEAARQSRELVSRMTSIGTSVRDAIGAQIRSRAALGAGGRFERLPNLDALELPVSHGISPPLVSGYDLLFQLKHGEHPVVSPASEKTLQSSAVPLSFATASYDLALRGTAAGQLPPADEIRVEDFLAGQHYVLEPAPFGELALHVAASPSPLGARGQVLLQLAVQSGPNRSSAHPPARLLIAVDTSSAMSNAARWETVLRALAHLAQDMSSGDRVTLVGFAEQPRLLAEHATSGELSEIIAGESLPSPTGSADLPAAIRTASDLVRGSGGQEARRVVFITAGREDFDDRALASSSAALAKLSGARIPWQIIRLTSDDADTRLAALATQGHGEISTAHSAVTIHEALAKKLIGRGSPVASRVSLRVTFNPKAVSGYRLLGHESRTLTGSFNPPLEVDFESDEIATGMFELWLKPESEDQIAAAELSWEHPGNGQPMRLVRPVRRTRFRLRSPNRPRGFNRE